MDEKFKILRKPWEKNKLVANFPEDKYHPTMALSSGKLKRLLDSPLHFAASFDNEGSDSDALRFGRLFHMALLEGERFRGNYIVMPEFEGKGSKKSKEEWLAHHKTAIIVKNRDEEKQIVGMLESVLRHKKGSELIAGQKEYKELTGFFNYRGYRCKIRIDILFNGQTVVDLKTAADASAKGFSRSALKYGYAMQAAWYLLGASLILKRPITSFKFLAVEKSPPYACNVFNVDDGFWSLGDRMVEIALKRLDRSFEIGEFESYSDEEQSLEIPPWEFRDIELIESQEGVSNHEYN